MNGINYEAMCNNLRTEHQACRMDGCEVSRELKKRFDRVRNVAIVLFVAGLGSMAGELVLGWPWWISVALIGSGWSCMCSADYIKGAVTRTGLT